MAIKPARIFISYARGDDPEFVQTLRDDLLERARASGDRRLRLFFDKQDMPSRGKSFLLEIRDFIGDPETERVLLVAARNRHWNVGKSNRADGQRRLVWGSALSSRHSHGDIAREILPL
jgi:hypothetical protein